MAYLDKNLVFMLNGDSVSRESSIYRNPFTLSGSVSSVSDASAFDGQACQFGGGTSDYLAVSDPIRLPGSFGTRDFHIYARLRVNSTSSVQAIVARNAAPGSQCWDLTIGAARDSVAFWSSNTGSASEGFAIGGSFNFADSAYHTVEVFRVSGTVYVTVDGTVVASGSRPSIYSDSQRLTVGRLDYPGVTLPLNGNIDQLVIFDGDALETGAHTPRTTPIPTPAFPVAVLGGGSIAIPGNTQPLSLVSGLVSTTFFAQDIWDGGTGTISGTVKIKQTSSNVPVARRVVLIDEQSNRIIRSTWSRASDGYYEFTGINASRKYTAVSFDYLHNYRAVLADNVSPA